MVLACLIDRAEEFRYALSYIKPEFFNGRIAFDVAYEINEYFLAYSRLPSFTVLANMAHDRFLRQDPNYAKAVFEYVATLKEIDTTEWEPIKVRCRAFAKERALQVVIKKLQVATLENKPFEGNAVQLVEDAVKVGEDFGDMGVEIHEDIDYIVNRLKDKNYGVKTGYPLLDYIWPFGWAPGWLIVPLAPPKRYKTTFCLNLALLMAGPQHDADVIYYACEIDQVHAMKRSLMSLTSTTEREIHRQPEHFRNLAKLKTDELVSGRILFKSFPSKTATLHDIKLHAKQAMTTYSIRPKVIFIDYAETVRSSTSGDKNTPDWRRSADVYTEARAMGAELGCCVVMPDRCKAEIVDRPVPGLNSFQGSFEKAGIVDVAIGLCATDGEKKQGKMRYFVFINRHGPEYGYFQGKVFSDVAQMTIDSKLEFDPDAQEDDKKERMKYRGRKRKAATDDLSNVTDD